MSISCCRSHLSYDFAHGVSAPQLQSGTGRWLAGTNAGTNGGVCGTFEFRLPRLSLQLLSRLSWSIMEAAFSGTHTTWSDKRKQDSAVYLQRMLLRIFLNA
jgi:hypothetical protein